MAKRGRPKIDRPLIDNGTPELQRRRLALVGQKGDPMKAEHALGVLLERKVITPDMYEAGRYYASIRKAVLGKAHVAIPDGTPKGEGQGRDLEAVEPKWHEACRILSKAGMWEKYEVDRVCIDELLPAWFSMRRPSRGRDRFIAGMTALTNWRIKGLREGRLTGARASCSLPDKYEVA